MLITKHSRRPLERLAHKEFRGCPLFLKSVSVWVFDTVCVPISANVVKVCLKSLLCTNKFKILLLSKFAQFLVHFLQRICVRLNLICLDKSFIKETDTVIFTAWYNNTLNTISSSVVQTTTLQVLSMQTSTGQAWRKMRCCQFSLATTLFLYWRRPSI